MSSESTNPVCMAQACQLDPGAHSATCSVTNSAYRLKQRVKLRSCRLRLVPGVLGIRSLGCNQHGHLHTGHLHQGGSF